MAKITRSLWSVRRICDEEFAVKFTKDDAVVVEKAGKVLCRFNGKGGLYGIKLRIKNPVASPKDFLRRGKHGR